jgi:hypothetical protein
MLCLSAWAWAMAGLSSTVRVECARVAGCVRLLRSILSQFLHCAWLRAPLLRRAVSALLLELGCRDPCAHARTATLVPTVSSFF